MRDQRQALDTLRSVYDLVEQRINSGLPGLGLEELAQHFLILDNDLDEWLTGKAGRHYNSLARRARSRIDSAAKMVEQMDRKLVEARDLLIEIMNDFPPQ